MLKSIFETTYLTRKTSVKELFFKKKIQNPLFSNGWLHGYHILPVLRHLRTLFKKCSFAAFVNFRKNGTAFKTYTCLKTL